jgi:dTDP-glucose 4,6-dehydratase
VRIVVTGGAGFIGSSFVRLLDKYNSKHGGFDIIVVDKLTYASNIERLPETVTLIEKDICDITKEDIGDTQYIVNFAAESHVDNSIEDGTPFIKTNVMGTFNLLEVARSMDNFEKFVQISTDEVYGDLHDYNNSKKLSVEGDRCVPSSYYSASKSAADDIVISAGRTFGLPFLITRTCNNYGRHQHREKFLPKVMDCIESDKPVPVYGDGGQIREWIWVEDNVQVIFDLMISEIGIYNIGTGDRCTNKEILVNIGKIINRPVKYEYVQDRLGHDRRYGLDCSRLESVTTFEPTINLIEYLTSELL